MALTPFIRLSWRDNAVNEDGFIVYRRTDGGAMLPVGAGEISAGSGGTVDFDDFDISPGETYQYQVGAWNMAAGESLSDPIDTAYDDFIPAAAPDSITPVLVYDNQSVSIGWTGVALANDYVVYMGDTLPLDLNDIVGTTDVLGIVVPAMVHGTTQYISVQARNAFGSGPMSDPVSLEVPLTVPYLDRVDLETMEGVLTGRMLLNEPNLPYPTEARLYMSTDPYGTLNPTWNYIGQSLDAWDDGVAYQLLIADPPDVDPIDLADYDGQTLIFKVEVNYFFAGTWVASNIIEKTIDLSEVAPAQPANFAADVDSVPGSVLLTWTMSGGATPDSYTILYQIEGWSSWVFVGSVDYPSMSILHESSAPGTQHTYAVAAANEGGVSPTAYVVATPISAPWVVDFVRVAGRFYRVDITPGIDTDYIKIRTYLYTQQYDYNTPADGNFIEVHTHENLTFDDPLSFYVHIDEFGDIYENGWWLNSVVEAYDSEDNLLYRSPTYHDQAYWQDSDRQMSLDAGGPYVDSNFPITIDGQYGTGWFGYTSEPISWRLYRLCEEIDEFGLVYEGSTSWETLAGLYRPQAVTLTAGVDTAPAPVAGRQYSYVAALHLEDTAQEVFTTDEKVTVGDTFLPPPHLVLRDQDIGSIDLAWEATDNGLGSPAYARVYRDTTLERLLDTEIDSFYAGLQPGTFSVEWSDTSVTPGQIYYYAVTASGTPPGYDYESVYSPVRAAIAGANPLPPGSLPAYWLWEGSYAEHPTHFEQFTVSGDGGIGTASTNAHHIEVYVSDVEGVLGSLYLDYFPVGDFDYPVFGMPDIEANVTKWVSFRSIDSNGTAIEDAVVEVVNYVDARAATNVQVTSEKADEISLSWDAPGTGTVQSLYVRWDEFDSQSAAGSAFYHGASQQQLVTPETSTSYTVIGLDSGIQYVFRIQVESDDGNTYYSEAITGTTT